MRHHALLDGHTRLLGAWPRRLREAPQITADVLWALPYALGDDVFSMRSISLGAATQMFSAQVRGGALWASTWRVPAYVQTTWA